MIHMRIVARPAFEIAGKKTWIAGTQDSQAFGRFWVESRAAGLFSTFEKLSERTPGPQTNGVTLGVSRVEQDPSNRAFNYMIAIEKPAGCAAGDLECYRVPAAEWAVFECRGQIPDTIVEAEIFAFSQWLPASGYVHAPAPEMEVYLPENGESGSAAPVCEFWLPIVKPE